MFNSSIQQQLKKACHYLQALPNPRLDAELLLAHALNVSRSYLIAWTEHELSHPETLTFERLLQRRLAGEPVAYITGKKEFWSLLFTVTPDTLAPRPETELLVELALEKLPVKLPLKIADLGTGSGAIALALAHECPHWEITATDIYAAALAVAKSNAKQLSLGNVIFRKGSWRHALSETPYNAILSNPPYIAQKDPCLMAAELKFEPQRALISGREGLDALYEIIEQAKNYLNQEGWLLLEHGFNQSQTVQQKMRATGYKNIATYEDLSGHPRVTVGQFSC